MKTFKELTTELIELSVQKRERLTSPDKTKNKAEYRKKKAKIKAYRKKWKQKGSTKALERKGAIMKKRGLTATGRKISVKGGAGVTQRATEKGKQLTGRK